MSRYLAASNDRDKVPLPFFFIFYTCSSCSSLRDVFSLSIVLDGIDALVTFHLLILILILSVLSLGQGKGREGKGSFYSVVLRRACFFCMKLGWCFIVAIPSHPIHTHGTAYAKKESNEGKKNNEKIVPIR